MEIFFWGGVFLVLLLLYAHVKRFSISRLWYLYISGYTFSRRCISPGRKLPCCSSPGSSEFIAHGTARIDRNKEYTHWYRYFLHCWLIFLCSVYSYIPETELKKDEKLAALICNPAPEAVLRTSSKLSNCMDSVTICRKAKGVSWWMKSLGLQASTVFGRGTSWGGQFTMVPKGISTHFHSFSSWTTKR